MARISRRTFIKTSAAAGALFATGTKLSAQARGANDRIRMAIAGVNGRGNSHIDEFGPMQDVEIAYVVDPDSRIYDRAIKRVEKQSKGRSKPKAIADIRTVLDDPNIDAISIATPNHWHALMTIWACQARKDVYVEKPCSHNVFEGRVAADVARKEKRIVQHGTQSRSSNSWAKTVEVIKKGHYGPLKVSRGIVYKKRDSIGYESPKTPPSELDFNLWLGPAQEQPYHDNLVHYDWHWFWDFGNGDIGNQGVHQMDIARWGIPNATWPKSVVSLGGRFGYEDQGQTPNTQLTVFDYGETQLIFEVRGLVPKNDCTNYFHFADGEIRDGKFYKNGSDKGEELPKVEDHRGPGDSHFANFIAAVRSRKVDDLNASVDEGHYSSGLCHLANISYRLGEPTPFDRKTGAFKGNEAASETFARMQDHLKEKGVKLDQERYFLGRHLQFDARKEQFADAQANNLLTREYRDPFTVPQALAKTAAS